MYKAVSDRTFQEAYARAQSSYNNNDWQALSPHQITEAIYRDAGNRCGEKPKSS
jgi:hypothetical protein